MDGSSRADILGSELGQKENGLWAGLGNKQQEVGGATDWERDPGRAWGLQVGEGGPRAAGGRGAGRGHKALAGLRN